MRSIASIVVAAALATALILPVHPAPAATERVIPITARRFVYEPSEITLKKGEPVILELTALDRDHGFQIAALGIRADLPMGQVTRVRLVPQQTGRYEFACDVFCGSGHEDMTGVIDVVE